MIKLEGVTREFNLDEQVIRPVDGVDLEVGVGEFVIIVGRSGTGKSTLLNLAAGLVRPSAGRVRLDGKYLDTLPDRELASFRSHRVGYVFQFPSLLPALTVRENVLLPSLFDGARGEAAAQRAEELLKMLGLGERLGSYPRHLSAGEQRRAVLARALLNRPALLLADEPTSDLDEATERDVVGRLSEIHATGVTILMVTHSSELIPYADRAYRMAEGKLERMAGR